jgi:hypothetical protein
MPHSFWFIVRLIDRGIRLPPFIDIDAPDYDSLILLHKNELPAKEFEFFGKIKLIVLGVDGKFARKFVITFQGKGKL